VHWESLLTSYPTSQVAVYVSRCVTWVISETYWRGVFRRHLKFGDFAPCGWRTARSSKIAPYTRQMLPSQTL
jgi:hypothetical protein